MKILLVRPRPSPETIGLAHVMVVEPLELEVLASLVNPDDTPTIVDMILEKRPIDHFIAQEKPDVFCVTGYITNVPAMIHYCEIAKHKNPHIVTIAGGVHCEVCPTDLDSAFIDFRIVRNATTVFPLLLKHIRGEANLPKGVLKPRDRSSQSELPPFDFHFPIPDRRLTAKYRKHYFYIFHDKVALIKTAFGCPGQCNFCFCRQITRDKYHERPLDKVIQELESIKEKNVYIVDDNFFASRARVVDFIQANQKAHLDKHYLLYGRADFIAHNPDVIQRFRAVGLRTVIVGFESFFDHELEQYNKNIDASTNEKAINILKAAGIDCYATIIVSPDWGPDEFSALGKKARELGIHYVNLQPLTPLPGTDQTVKDEDLVVPYSEFTKWDLAHVTIRPTRMSVADFYTSIVRLYDEILFQPRFLLGYIKAYNLPMLWKMLRGSFSVRRQYMRKIKEAKRDAQNPVHPANPVWRR
jgi:radical SAM superfamily enzyme YgiQ (UPF0313 family)